MDFLVTKKKYIRLDFVKTLSTQTLFGKTDKFY